MAAPRHRDLQYVAGNNELARNGGFPDFPEHVDDTYPSMCLSSLESTGLHFEENDAGFSAANYVVSNNANSPFESIPAHGKLLDATGDSTANYYECLNAEEYCHSDWADMEHLQSLPSDQGGQIDQLYPNNSPSPVTSALVENIEARKPTLTPPLPKYPAPTNSGLPQRKSRYMIHHIEQQANPIFIPSTASLADPLERWKKSPPEGEAASLSAIKNALENPSTYSGANQGSSIPGPLGDNLFQNNRRPASRAPSTASGGSATSASSRRSNRSGLSALSNGSQAASDKKSARVRKNQASTGRKKGSSANNPRVFCCTFCCDKFKNKYDWVRHEKSLHINLENWLCAPFGGSVELPSTGRTHCAYCNQLDPTVDHLEQHNYGLCRQELRTFRRKDHLLQHLRLFHHLDVIPLIDSWKSVFTDFPSRCGFCDGRMSNWNERADHLAFHFRKGCTMAQWNGDHEFPPEITAQVRHSVPPYLLDFESRSLVPFSATNRDVNDHLSQMLSRATFLDATGGPQMAPVSPDVELQSVPEPQLESYTKVLTSHLSHYAQRMMGSGIVPTDEMFQLEARRLLFDSEDQWNQTMADNPEWLAKFREQGSIGPLQTWEQAFRDK